jgi:hypothetical protein
MPPTSSRIGMHMLFIEMAAGLAFNPIVCCPPNGHRRVIPGISNGRLAGLDG